MARGRGIRREPEVGAAAARPDGSAPAEHQRARAVRSRLAALADAERTSVPVWRGDRSFVLRAAPDRDFPALYVEAGGVQRVVLDPAALDPSGQSPIAGWECSPDGRLLAYQLSRGGAERSVLWVMDVDAGE